MLNIVIENKCHQRRIRVTQNRLIKYLLIVGLGLLLGFLNAMGFIELTLPILVIFAALYIIIAFFIVSNHRRKNNYIVSLILDHVDPDLYLQHLQKELIKAKDNSALLVNKSAGHMFKGEFSSAISILESINPTKLKTNFKYIYYNNLSNSLLESGRLDDAIKIINDGLEALGQKMVQKDYSFKANKAFIDFYQGNLTESREGLSELIQGPLPNSGRAVILLYLGQIDLKQGDHEMGIRRLQEAKKIGAKTFIANRVDTILKVYTQS